MEFWNTDTQFGTARKYLVTLINATVLQRAGSLYYSYPTLHSWIITACVSLGNLKKQWRVFVRQMGRTQQLLNSLQQKPLDPAYMISVLQVELINLDSIYTSYKPLILTATQLLRREPAFNGVSPFNKCARRSLLPFLRDALSWLKEQQQLRMSTVSRTGSINSWQCNTNKKL